MHWLGSVLRFRAYNVQRTYAYGFYFKNINEFKKYCLRVALDAGNAIK